MLRWQCQIHNDTLKSFVRSSLIKISMFIVLKTDYFQLWVLSKNKSDFSTAGKERNPPDQSNIFLNPLFNGI